MPEHIGRKAEALDKGDLHKYFQFDKGKVISHSEVDEWTGDEC